MGEKAKKDLKTAAKAIAEADAEKAKAKTNAKAEDVKKGLDEEVKQAEDKLDTHEKRVAKARSIIAEEQASELKAKAAAAAAKLKLEQEEAKKAEEKLLKAKVKAKQLKGAEKE